jgi:hypothetical protein
MSIRVSLTVPTPRGDFETADVRQDGRYGGVDPEQGGR